MMSLYLSGVDDEDPIEIDITPFNAPVHAIIFHNPCPLIAFNGLISISYS
jgi:hypothetical protein